VRLRILEVGLLVGLLVGACSSGTTTTTTTSTTTSTTTTTVATTTTSTLPPGTPGDTEVLAARIEGMLFGLALQYPDIPAEDYPFPNTITPDPVEAVREMWEFEAWQAQNAPWSDFRQLLFVPGSPADDRAGAHLDERAMGGFILQFEDSVGFQWEGGEVIPMEESTLPSDLVSEVPVGSVVVRWQYSQALGRWILSDTGSLVREEPEVAHRQVDTVVSPTDYGWLMWWILAL